jgi:hypothetical protein
VSRRLSFARVAAPAVAILAPAVVAAAPPAAGLPDFAAITTVLQSPRCKNCHPGDGVPRVGDAGRRHRMNVSRRSVAAGLPCTTCDRDHNAPFAHGPPGVPDWRMPPEEHPMVFDGTSPHDLCLALKDPAKNGGKSLPALREHFENDPLVLWAYAPGPGRTLPPIAHDDLVKRVDAWIAAGAPCPD